MFKHVPFYAGDPIFEVGEAFHCDPREQKVNLSVGLYCDDDETVPVLASVTQAGRRLAEIRRPGARPAQGHGAAHLLNAAIPRRLRHRHFVTQRGMFTYTGFSPAQALDHQGLTLDSLRVPVKYT